jgi:hypothetical protein
VDGRVTLHSWQATASGPSLAAAKRASCSEGSMRHCEAINQHKVFYFHRKENNFETNVWAKYRNFVNLLKPSGFFTYRQI